MPALESNDSVVLKGISLLEPPFPSKRLLTCHYFTHCLPANNARGYESCLKL